MKIEKMRRGQLGRRAAMIALGAGIVCLAGASASRAESAEGTAPAIDAKAAGNLSSAAPAAVGTVLLKGEVVYLKRRCYTAAGRTAEPLAGATLTFDQRGQGPVTLDSKGGFRARLAARFPIHGWVVLDGARLSVGPDVVGAAPYRIPLGALAHMENGRVVVIHRFAIAGAGPAGAANIWTVLNLAARVADSAAPGAVPRVKAGWRYLPNLVGWLGDTTDPTNWEKATKTIHVEGRHDGKRAEWEPFVLLHEYGHALLDSVASPGDFAAGDHSFTSVHKDQPALPWSEGFGDAFAAIVLKRADLELGCQPQLNLGATPATPLPDDQRLAQYNEVAIAGVLWHLADFFGSGSAQNGLRQILDAIHKLPPHSAREFLDALIHDLTGNASTIESLDGIFFDQELSWAVSVSYTNTDTTSAGELASNAVQIVVDGPYGSCTPSGTNGSDTSHGYYPAFGDIPDSNADDCSFTDVSDGGQPPDCTPPPGRPPPPCNSSQDVTGEFSLDLPYKSDESHLNPKTPFTVSARWLCTTLRTTDANGTQDPKYACPPIRSFTFTVHRQQARDQSVGISLSGDYTFTQSGGQPVPIAQFDGQGNCKLLIAPGGDCSV